MKNDFSHLILLKKGDLVCYRYCGVTEYAEIIEPVSGTSPTVQRIIPKPPIGTAVIRCIWLQDWIQPREIVKIKA